MYNKTINKLRKIKTLQRHLFCFNYVSSHTKFANIIYTVTSAFNVHINGRITQYRLLSVLAKDSLFFLFLKLVEVNIVICRQCPQIVHVILGSFIYNENAFFVLFCRDDRNLKMTCCLLHPDERLGRSDAMWSVGFSFACNMRPLKHVTCI